MKRRQTSQKHEILNYLSSVKTHPKAEIVYKGVKERLPKITLATVYRNLNLLAEEGKILRLEINKEYHYDADITSHQHFVCLDTGKIYDLYNKNLEKKVLSGVKHKNLIPEKVEIIYYGKKVK
jgi:Fur family transcriptional regulator, peroxide stress response regulator